MRLGAYCPTAQGAHEDLVYALDCLDEKQRSFDYSKQLLKEMLDSRRQYDSLCKQYSLLQQQQYISSNSGTAAAASTAQQQHSLVPQVLASGTTSNAEVTWVGGSKELAALMPNEAILEVLGRELLLLEVKQHVMEIEQLKMDFDMRQTDLDIGQVRYAVSRGHSGGPHGLGRTY